MDKPVIFTAFANPKDDLRQLKEEESALIDLFTPLADADKVFFSNLPNVKIEKLYQHINRFHRRILIFHYGGHADDHLLMLDDNPNYAEGLALALARQNKNLLIFLNGCSTKAQVEKLIEAGASAVIATTAKIKDGLSRAFAEEFYRLLIQGKTLELAFDLAKAKALGMAGAENLAFKVMRGILFLEEEEEVIFPWVLYVKYEDQLQWKLEEDYFNPDYLPDPVEMVLAQKQEAIETMREKIHNLEAEMATALDLIKLYEKYKHEPAFASQIDTKRKEIEDLAKAIKDKEVDISRGDEELRTEKREAELSESQKLLHRELERINYDQQFSSYGQIVDLQAKLGAFIMQGTPQCGLGFLRDRILKKASVQFSYWKVIVDFSPLSTQAPDEQSIWKTLARHFSLEETLEPAAIVKAIFSTGRLRYKHLLLFFENLSYPDITLNIRLIKEFWFLFQQEARIHNTAENNPDGNKTLLFISDINCRNKESGDCIPKQYQEKIEAEKLEQNYAFVLPIVDILNLNYLKNWANQLPDELGLSDPVFQEILDLHKGFVLPTIKEICSRTQTESMIYNEYFARYE
ncbi:MAG: hypothetical protein DHS20C18_49340 [Saprospiraceae bacterium]|nr:MAG: hypothetical protein DHS20C18_49340 [Saprospiraceae bacterium]